MHLAIDIREALREKRTGKGQWTRGFVTELLTREHPVTCFTQNTRKGDVMGRGERTIVIPYDGLFWHLAAANTLRRQRNRFDYYLSPTSFIVPALLRGSPQCIPVVHDLIAFQNEPHETRARLIERLTLKRALTNAPLILTISDATKRDLQQQFPRLPAERIISVYAGPLRPAASENTSDGRTILCAATLCPRKNQERLILAFRALPESLKKQFRLVLIGARGWNDDRIVTLAKKTPGVEWRAYVSDAEYEHLLQHCSILALPSLYEGFGMQILDALQRGIPVLTSKRGSLAEVAGDAAEYVDPESIPSIASGLSRLLKDRDLQQRLRSLGPAQASRFSWKRTVDLFLEALLRIPPKNA